MNKIRTYYQPCGCYDGGMNLGYGDVPSALMDFQAFASEEDAMKWLENNGYNVSEFEIIQYADDDIENVTILDGNGNVVEINEEKTMENIFEGAKFGDKFKTRDGQIVVYWHYDTKDPYQMPHWVCFVDGSFTHYADDGIYHKGNIHSADLDIVGRLAEPVDEEKLESLAVEYENKMYGYSVILGDDIKTDQSNQQNIIDIHDAFIAGYRKAKEE